MFNKPSSQSQSFTNSPVSGQVLQSGNDATVVHQGNQTIEEQKQLTIAEVIDLLIQVETMIKSANLPEPTKEKTMTYLNAAKAEVEEFECCNRI